jgi:putative transposase
MKKRYSDEQIIGFLKEADSGMPVKELCRRHGFSDASFYAWRSKSGGMDISEAKRLKVLEAENAKLKKLLAETMLENDVIKEALQKNGDRTGTPRGGELDAEPRLIRAQSAEDREYERQRTALSATARSEH